MAGGVAADKRASLINVSGVLTIDQVSAAVEGCLLQHIAAGSELIRGKSTEDFH
jgi:hypothetical protein